MNVLFAAMGRRVELLRGFRAAQQSLGLEGFLIGIDVDPLAPALGLTDRPYLVPRLDDDAFISTLLEICRDDRVDLIFPLIDPMIEVLADHRPEIEATGARLAVVPLASARIANDKLLLHDFFQSLDLPTPRTWLPDQLEPERAEYPLFIKPRRGSASQETFKVRNAEELRFFSTYIEAPIVQEFLPGPEITTDVVCGLNGDVLGVVSRRRIEVRSGEVSKGVTVHDRAILEACVEIAKAFPAIGPITVQCLFRNGEPHFTEINARLGGGVPLAIAAGLDVPALLLAHAAGLPMVVPSLGAYRAGVHMTRFDDSFFLTAEELSAMRHRSSRNDSGDTSEEYLVDEARLSSRGAQHGVES